MGHPNHIMAPTAYHPLVCPEENKIRVHNSQNKVACCQRSLLKTMGQFLKKKFLTESTSGLNHGKDDGSQGDQ